MSAPVLLLGNQNAGKTTLFNALTGMRAKVANYPGVTIEARVGQLTRFVGEKVPIVDLPGTYSLLPASEEEELTVRALFGELSNLREHSLVVVVVDCTEMRRGLYLYAQCIELGFKAIIALSMVDQRSKEWSRHAVECLSKATGALVTGVSAHDKASIQRLINTIDGVLSGSLKPHIKDAVIISSSLPAPLQAKLSRAGQIKMPPHAQNSRELIINHNIYLYRLAERSRLNKSERDIEHLELSDEDKTVLNRVIAEIPEQRFLQIDNWIKDIKSEPDLQRQKSDLVDKFLLQPIFGGIFLLLLFVGMLQALFLLAKPLADLMGDGIATLGQYVRQILPEHSILRSLVTDGIFEGVGSVLSFLPLIALVFIFLTLLEDSGYLARATFLLDKVLKRVGLGGRSLMPMMSGFACAVPAIMATRTIGNRKERLITILVTPFLTCSARLPIFGLIVGALFSAYPPLFGLFDMGAFIFVMMYSLGFLASILAAMLLSRILKTEMQPSLAISLPPYRLPNLWSVLKRVYERIVVFVRDVGSVILASTIIIWALFHFEPYSPERPLAKAEIGESYAGRIGHAIEPLVKPLGLDWSVGVGILASFLAREVFVSTMAVVYGLSSDHEENSGGTRLQDAFKQHISPLSGLCLLIFFTLSMQCLSTMATTRRETGSFLWPLVQFVMMSGSGYLLAVLVYTIGESFWPALAFAS